MDCFLGIQQRTPEKTTHPVGVRLRRLWQIRYRSRDIRASSKWRSLACHVLLLPRRRRPGRNRTASKHARKSDGDIAAKDEASHRSCGEGSASTRPIRAPFASQVRFAGEVPFAGKVLFLIERSAGAAGIRAIQGSGRPILFRQKLAIRSLSHHHRRSRRMYR
jgi:hypothetical protein